MMDLIKQARMRALAYRNIGCRVEGGSEIRRVEGGGEVRRVEEGGEVRSPGALAGSSDALPR